MRGDDVIPSAIVVLISGSLLTKRKQGRCYNNDDRVWCGALSDSRTPRASVDHLTQTPGTKRGNVVTRDAGSTEAGQRYVNIGVGVNGLCVEFPRLWCSFVVFSSDGRNAISTSVDMTYRRSLLSGRQ